MALLMAFRSALRSYRTCFAALCLAAIALPVQAADPEARHWLERMSEALATRNYEGRFFHLDGNRPKEMRIIHRVDKGKVTERLLSLDGAGPEIIRTDSEVICYLPERRTVVVEKRTDDNSLLVAVPTYSEALEEHYNIERGSYQRSLGRRTQIINVTPRDHFRYGYRLWLDDETAMPLRSQLLDRNGQVIEQILFAEVNFRDRIPASALKPSVDASGFQWVRQDTRPPSPGDAMLGWNVARAPAGFRVRASRLQLIAGSSGPARHLVLSDGLASVSVFIEPLNPKNKALSGLAKVGAAFAYTRAMDGYQVIVLGEVPAATVESIATGITKEGPQPPPLAREPMPPVRR